MYANTLYRAKSEYFNNPQWSDLDNWEQALTPHYDTAERMLGVNTVPYENPGDDMLRDVAKHVGTQDTFCRTPVGVYFGEPDVKVADPYFGGQGPDRTGRPRIRHNRPVAAQSADNKSARACPGHFSHRCRCPTQVRDAPDCSEPCKIHCRNNEVHQR